MKKLSILLLSLTLAIPHTSKPEQNPYAIVGGLIITAASAVGGYCWYNSDQQPTVPTTPNIPQQEPQITLSSTPPNIEYIDKNNYSNQHKRSNQEEENKTTTLQEFPAQTPPAPIILQKKEDENSKIPSQPSAPIIQEETPKKLETTAKLPSLLERILKDLKNNP